MGGFGSGRWYRYEKKTTTEECRSIGINSWTREDRRRGHPFSWDWPNSSNLISTVDVNREPEGLWLKYRYGAVPQERIEMGYLIPIEYTSTGYGQRPWFCCPRCSRRSGKLYLVASYPRLICRKCANLSYRSQNES